MKLMVRQDDWSERVRVRAKINELQKQVVELETRMGFERERGLIYREVVQRGEYVELDGRGGLTPLPTHGKLV